MECGNKWEIIESSLGLISLPVFICETGIRDSRNITVTIIVSSCHVRSYIKYVLCSLGSDAHARACAILNKAVHVQNSFPPKFPGKENYEY